jgi:FecR protein
MDRDFISRLSAMTLVVVFVPFYFNTAGADAAVSTDIGSVGIISSLNGEARITHPADTQQSDRPKYRGPIIYGDRLSTGKNATIGLLVGQNSLLTMRELTEIRIAETVRNRQVLEMTSGRVCLAVGQPVASTTEPLMLKTPTSMITVAPGTLFNVDVTAAPLLSSLPDGAGGGRVIPIARPTQMAKGGTAPVVETYQVIEGSIDIVSLASSSSPISLRTGQSLRVTGGVRTQPFVAPPVNCRTQDVQIIPSHTTIPMPAQRTIVQQQMQAAGIERVAAMTQSSGGQLSTGTMPSGVILPYTGTTITNPTTSTTITVTLP